MNICPVCTIPLSYKCGNPDCRPCQAREEPTLVYEKLDRPLEDCESIEVLKCPVCGFVESFSWWEQQDIEIFIATQLAEASGSFVKAGELHTERMKKYGKQKTSS